MRTPLAGLAQRSRGVVGRAGHLRGVLVKHDVEDEGLLPGPVCVQCVLRVLAGVHEHHSLGAVRGRARRRGRSQNQGGGRTPGLASTLRGIQGLGPDLGRAAGLCAHPQAASPLPSEGAASPGCCTPKALTVSPQAGWALLPVLTYRRPTNAEYLGPAWTAARMPLNSRPGH